MHALERDLIELEENLQRRDLTAFERSKTVKRAVEVAERVERGSARSSRTSKKEGRGKKGGRRAAAERVGVPESTARDAEKHVEIAERHTFMQFPTWRASCVVRLSRPLRSLWGRMPPDTQGKELLDAAIDAYLDDAGAIAFESFVSYEASRVAHDHYLQLAAQLSSLPEDTVLLGARAVAWDFLTEDQSGLGARFPMRGRSVLRASKADFLLDALNSQFCWHLVAAVESLQGLFRRVAAILGFLGRTGWPARHFGTLTLNEVEVLGFEWFTRSCKEMKFGDVLNNVRSALPQFARHERDNAVGRDLHEWYVVLSYLRHTVVHRAGVLPLDWEVRIAEKLGSSVRGEPAVTDQWRSQLARWVQVRDGSAQVWLVSDDDRPDLKHARTLDISAILEVVNGHAWMLYVDALAHFGHEMTNERKATVIGHRTSP